eukprot:GFYU01003231.1.p1 GENE.GFYU01003231.1~~GFYU01003231.1.p1  ORF type:complete len:871 (-),score=254.88 GFYU01003231.1:108-2720(-)
MVHALKVRLVSASFEQAHKYFVTFKCEDLSGGNKNKLRTEVSQETKAPIFVSNSFDFLLDPLKGSTITAEVYQEDSATAQSAKFAGSYTYDLSQLAASIGTPRAETFSISLPGSAAEAFHGELSVELLATVSTGPAEAAMKGVRVRRFVFYIMNAINVMPTSCFVGFSLTSDQRLRGSTTVVRDTRHPNFYQRVEIHVTEEEFNKHEQIFLSIYDERTGTPSHTWPFRANYMAPLFPYHLDISFDGSPTHLYLIVTMQDDTSSKMSLIKNHPQSHLFEVMLSGMDGAFLGCVKQVTDLTKLEESYAFNKPSMPVHVIMNDDPNIRHILGSAASQAASPDAARVLIPTHPVDVSWEESVVFLREPEDNTYFVFDFYAHGAIGSMGHEVEASDVVTSFVGHAVVPAEKLKSLSASHNGQVETLELQISLHRRNDDMAIGAPTSLLRCWGLQDYERYANDFEEPRIPTPISLPRGGTSSGQVTPLTSARGGYGGSGQLEQRLIVLTDDIKKKQELIDRLLRDLDERNEVIRQCGVEIMELRKRNKQILAENAELKRQLREKDNMVLRYIDDVEDIAVMPRDNLETRYRAVAASFRYERIKTEELTNRLKQAQRELQKKTHNERQIHELQNAHMEQANFIHKLQEEKAKIDKYKLTTKNQEKVIEKLEKLLESTIQESKKVEFTEQAKGNAEQQVRQLQQKLQEQERKNKDLQDRDAKAHKKEIEHLQDEIRREAKQNEEQMRRNQELVRELENANINHRNNSDDYADAQSEKDKIMLTMRAEKAEMRIAALETELVENSKKYGKEISMLKVKLAEKDAMLMGGFGSAIDMPAGDDFLKGGPDGFTPVPPMKRSNSRPRLASLSSREKLFDNGR